MTTGYNIREGSRILAERFGMLDKRQEHPLALPLVEQAVPRSRPLPLPSPRPAPKKEAA